MVEQMSFCDCWVSEGGPFGPPFLLSPPYRGGFGLRVRSNALHIDVQVLGKGIATASSIHAGSQEGLLCGPCDAGCPTTGNTKPNRGLP